MRTVWEQWAAMLREKTELSHKTYKGDRFG